MLHICIQAANFKLFSCISCIETAMLPGLFWKNSLRIPYILKTRSIFHPFIVSFNIWCHSHIIIESEKDKSSGTYISTEKTMTVSASGLKAYWSLLCLNNKITTKNIISLSPLQLAIHVYIFHYYKKYDFIQSNTSITKRFCLC